MVIEIADLGVRPRLTLVRLHAGTQITGNTRLTDEVGSSLGLVARFGR